MNVTGTATLAAPVHRVWEALQDPEVLVRTIPGCLELVMTGPDAYRVTVVAGVASIKGTYQGDVRLTEQVRPSAFVLRASGQGAPGTVDASVRVALSDLGDGRTGLEYDADATVGGPIGGVGQRMLAAVARKTAGEFFTAVDGVLTGAAPQAAPPGAPAPAPPGVPAPAPPGVPAPAPPGVPTPAPPGVPTPAPAGAGQPAAAGPPPAGPVFRAPAPPPRPAAPGLLPLALVGIGGAVVALAGVVVGAVVGARAARRR